MYLALLPSAGAMQNIPPSMSSNCRHDEYGCVLISTLWLAAAWSSASSLRSTSSTVSVAGLVVMFGICHVCDATLCISSYVAMFPGSHCHSSFGVHAHSHS